MSLGKTHKSRGWGGGGGNYVLAFVCVRGVLLMLELLIWWKLNGMWGYLLFAI